MIRCRGRSHSHFRATKQHAREQYQGGRGICSNRWQYECGKRDFALPRDDDGSLPDHIVHIVGGLPSQIRRFLPPMQMCYRAELSDLSRSSASPEGASDRGHIDGTGSLKSRNGGSFGRTLVEEPSTPS